MDRILLLFITCGTCLIIGFATVSAEIRKGNSVIVLESNKIAGQSYTAHYYAFNIVDYHKYLIQKKPFILFFYTNDCQTCIWQHKELIRKFSPSGDFTSPILGVSLNDATTDTSIAQIAKTYHVSQAHTFVFVDRDSNAITYLFGYQPIETILKYMKKV